MVIRSGEVVYCGPETASDLPLIELHVRPRPIIHTLRYDDYETAIFLEAAPLIHLKSPKLTHFRDLLPVVVVQCRIDLLMELTLRLARTLPLTYATITLLVWL